MKSREKYNVILGGGIAGLMSAMILAQNEKQNILIIESADDVGGLLRSFHYEHHGMFDYGTHYFSSGVTEEVHNLLFHSLPENDWNILKGVRSDVSGVFYNDTLQKNTVFVDSRNLPEEKRKEYIGEVMFQINTNTKPNVNTVSAYDYLSLRYGDKITNEVFEPILENIFGLNSKKLHHFAAKLIPLQRMVLFDEEIALDLLNTNKVNNVLAFPEQLYLPESLAPKYFSYYPKVRGIQKVIDSIVRQLESTGVTVKVSTSIEGVSIENERIKAVNFSDGKELLIENFISTISLFGLSKLFNIQHKAKLDRPKHTIITNLIIEKDIDLPNHYFYCYESEMSTFRVTNYNAITGINDSRTPLTIESLHEELLTESAYNKLIISELIKMRLINNEEEVSFIKTEILKYGFPCLSITNVDTLNELRKKFDSMKLSNFTRLGVLSEDNVFFMRDILRNVHERVKLL